MKRVKCPKCGKTVYKSEKFGDLRDRKDTKKHKRMIESLGLGASYGGTYKAHKCR